MRNQTSGSAMLGRLEDRHIRGACLRVIQWLLQLTGPPGRR